MNKEELLGHLEGETEKAIGVLVLDLAKLAWETNQPQVSDFLDAAQLKVSRSVLGAVPEIGALAMGGYKKAKRARLFIYPQYFLLETLDPPIRVLEARGDFLGQDLTCDDFLASLLKTGVQRGQIGDIILLEDGCQVVVATQWVAYLVNNWREVRQTAIQVKEIDAERLAVEPERIKEIKTTVASLRLDAVAAEGFGTSRTKMARQIKADQVKLNWKVVANPALSVNEGDILAIQRRGRVLLYSVGGKTRKGRMSIILHRYYF